MKSTGIVRKLDELGRIVLPKELRDVLNLKGGVKGTGDPLEIFIDGDNIILKKYTPGCHCCSNVEKLVEVIGIKLCPSCLQELNEARDLINNIRGI